jgi:5-hydroxyisourate hydrolase
VPVVLEVLRDGGFHELGKGVTDEDGRLRTLLREGVRPDRGTYRLRFQTKVYFATHGVKGFYPEVCVTFQVRAPDEHYHVPLLLSPYGYSTYRGS